MIRPALNHVYRLKVEKLYTLGVQHNQLQVVKQTPEFERPVLYLVIKTFQNGGRLGIIGESDNAAVRVASYTALQKIEKLKSKKY